MTCINQQFVQFSQVPTTKPIVVAHQDLERIRGRSQPQCCSQRRAELEAHIERLTTGKVCN